ncbi:hypothetical protein HYQ46_012938 [Verticillium longisporum]|nr:hypothetical protein HYQ46_012938 [Verticillium longisporum]
MALELSSTTSVGVWSSGLGLVENVFCCRSGSLGNCVRRVDRNHVFHKRFRIGQLFRNSTGGLLYGLKRSRAFGFGFRRCILLPLLLRFLRGLGLSDVIGRLRGDGVRLRNRSRKDLRDWSAKVLRNRRGHIFSDLLLCFLALLALLLL